MLNDSPLTFRSRYEVRNHEPVEHHMLSYATGGLQLLFNQIKSHTVPMLREYGFYTDDEGVFSLGDGQCILALRYRCVEVLGTGQSSIVIKAQDQFCEDKLVAIKILHTGYYQLGAQETHCLLSLRAQDPFGFSHVCQLLNTFSYDGHFCMVFELLHQPNWTNIFHTKDSKVTDPEVIYPRIRKVAVRLLQVLGFLQQQNVIHADLKPENILLQSESDLSSAKIVDFGNAIHCIHDEVSLYYDDFELQTLLYRAPEVMFGLPFGTEIDMWSLGCILAEMFLGRPLFFGTNKDEVLQKMVQLLGPIPRPPVKRGKFFSSLEMFTHCATQPDATSVMRSVLETGRVKKCTNYAFANFLAQLLRFDPGERLSPSEAARHLFLGPEMGMAYLFPPTGIFNADGERCYPTILVSKTSYSHKPYIDKEILRQHPSSIDLMYMGTSSPNNTPDERVNRRIAEVSPLRPETLLTTKPPNPPAASLSVERKEIREQVSLEFDTKDLSSAKHAALSNSSVSQHVGDSLSIKTEKTIEHQKEQPVSTSHNFTCSENVEPTCITVLAPSPSQISVQLLSCGQNNHTDSDTSGPTAAVSPKSPRNQKHSKSKRRNSTRTTAHLNISRQNQTAKVTAEDFPSKSCFTTVPIHKSETIDDSKNVDPLNNILPPGTKKSLACDRLLSSSMDTKVGTSGVRRHSPKSCSSKRVKRGSKLTAKSSTGSKNCFRTSTNHSSSDNVCLKQDVKPSSIGRSSHSSDVLFPSDIQPMGNAHTAENSFRCALISPSPLNSHHGGTDSKSEGLICPVTKGTHSRMFNENVSGLTENIAVENCTDPSTNHSCQISPAQTSHKNNVRLKIQRPYLSGSRKRTLSARSESYPEGPNKSTKTYIGPPIDRDFVDIVHEKQSVPLNNEKHSNQQAGNISGSSSNFTQKLRLMSQSVTTFKSVPKVTCQPSSIHGAKSKSKSSSTKVQLEETNLVKDTSSVKRAKAKRRKLVHRKQVMQAIASPLAKTGRHLLKPRAAKAKAKANIAFDLSSDLSYGSDERAELRKDMHNLVEHTSKTNTLYRANMSSESAVRHTEMASITNLHVKQKQLEKSVDMKVDFVSDQAEDDEEGELTDSILGRSETSGLQSDHSDEELLLLKV